jgi:hypothetical protein
MDALALGPKGTPIGPTPIGPTPIGPTPIGTPTSSASTTTSCYHYLPSPIDNLMSLVNIDDDCESNEFENDKSTGSLPVRGGQPPFPKNYL